MMEKDEATKGVVVKKTYRNNWLSDAALNLEPGDNRLYIQISAKLMEMPEIDLKDPAQVAKRLGEYFSLMADNDTKPTVAGLGLALGLDRRRLWEIRNDNLEHRSLPPETVDLIKKAHKVMENLWENYMNNGKINPVTGIFMGKNQFGYQDKSEVVLTPNNPLGDARDTKALEAQYIESVTSGDEK